jgi:acetylornithine deacetylase
MTTHGCKDVSPSLAAEILASVEAGFEEQVRFTQDLVRFPSLRGLEGTAQDFLHDRLAERGLSMDRWSIDVDAIRDHPGFSPVKVDYSRAINVVGTHRPKNQIGRSLILNGHVDVVPEGPLDMWTRPPFDPWIEGDWLYGRGAGDMKAGLVANIFALDALKRLGKQPGAPVHVQSVTEEECTGNGALACLVRGYRAEAAIIPEPEQEMLVRANLGVIWFKIHVRGHPVHVARAGTGANAIEAAMRIMAALRELEAQWNRPERRHSRFHNHAHPINLNFGKIAGGDWASSVPAWCVVDCRIAMFPGTDPKQAAQEIEDCMRKAALSDPFLSNHPPEIEYNGFFARGYELPEGTQAEGMLGIAHALAHGQELKSFAATAYVDGRVFMLYDDTPCLVYGPKAESYHGFDERVSLSSVKRVTGTIALFIAGWCGLESL